MESRRVMAVFLLSAIFLGVFTSNCAGGFLDCDKGRKCWNKCIKRHWVITCNAFCPPDCDSPGIPLWGHEDKVRERVGAPVPAPAPSPSTAGPLPANC